MWTFVYVSLMLAFQLLHATCCISFSLLSACGLQMCEVKVSSPCAASAGSLTFDITALPWTGRPTDIVEDGLCLSWWNLHRVIACNINTATDFSPSSDGHLKFTKLIVGVKLIKVKLIITFSLAGYYKI